MAHEIEVIKNFNWRPW